jgi:excisionase family DNA binding protein
MMTEISEAQERVPYAPPPRWLTVPEVARALSIGRERAYELVGTEIPAMRFGPRRIRVSEAALAEWMDSQEDYVPPESH